MQTWFLSSRREEGRARELQTSQCHLNPWEDGGDNPPGKHFQTSPTGDLQLCSEITFLYSEVLSSSQLFPFSTKEKPLFKNFMKYKHYYINGILLILFLTCDVKNCMFKSFFTACAYLYIFLFQHIFMDSNFWNY